MELITENILTIVSAGIVALLAYGAKLWRRSYKGVVPAEVIQEEAILKFIVHMAKEQNLEIDQKEDIDFLVEFGRLKLKEVGIHIDKEHLERIVSNVKAELKV